MFTSFEHQHIPVLAREVLALLDPKPDEVIVDCTLGLGGHTKLISDALQGTGRVYGLDADIRNLTVAKERLSTQKNVAFIHDNFGHLQEHLARIKTQEKRVDGILFDLGLSSVHVDDAARGFSFMREGPLDMRYDTRKGQTAADIVNTYTLPNLISLFKTYGEEPFSNRIAEAIVTARKLKEFQTTTQLAECIGQSVRSSGKVHPATRVFQALRIATNREIEVLVQGLTAAVNGVDLGGRVVVISYHSLEDRIVKNLFRDLKKDHRGVILTKKPTVPTEEEIRENRRARSAKLRGIKIETVKSKSEKYKK